MIRLQRIVVPLSMTAADKGLLRYASLVAGLGITREVHFVHVITPVRQPAVAPQAGDVRAEMELKVNQHFEPAKCDAAVECHAVEGTRIDRLASLVIEKKADVILLGDGKGRTRHRSLAERLAMVTSCSVWMVPEGSPDRIGKILAPIDFSDHSADSLGVAAALARLQDIDVVESLYANAPAEDHGGKRRNDSAGDIERHRFSDFLARTNSHGIYVDPVFVESNQPADAILSHVRHATADLIVMSTRGERPTAGNLLGSATARTLAESPIPVLVVKLFDPHASLLGTLCTQEPCTGVDARTT